MRTASGGPLSPCVANPDECYGGVAAEIGVKNMPPACFLNTPTRKVGKRASRNQGSCTSLRAMHCTNRNCLPHVHRKFPVSFRHRIVSAPAPLPLMLSTVDHSALYGGGVRAPRPTQRLPVEFRRARCPHRAAYRAVVLVVGCRGRRPRRPSCFSAAYSVFGGASGTPPPTNQSPKNVPSHHHIRCFRPEEIQQVGGLHLHLIFPAETATSSRSFTVS